MYPEVKKPHGPGYLSATAGSTGTGAGVFWVIDDQADLSSAVAVGKIISSPRRIRASKREGYVNKELKEVKLSDIL